MNHHQEMIKSASQQDLSHSTINKSKDGPTLDVAKNDWKVKGIDLKNQNFRSMKNYPYEYQSRNLGKLASLTARNNYHSIVSNFEQSRLTAEYSVEYVSQELDNKRNQVLALTKEMKDLKTQIPGRIAYRTCRQANPFESRNLLSMPENGKVSALERENVYQKAEIEKYKRSNDHLMSKVSDKGNSIYNNNSKIEPNELSHLKSYQLNDYLLKKDVPNKSKVFQKNHTSIFKHSPHDDLKPNKNDPINSMPSINYYKVSDQIDKLTVSCFKFLISEDFQEITKSLLKECLFIVPADSYVATYDINDYTQQFITLPYDYDKKYYNMSYPTGFKHAEIEKSHKEILREQSDFQEIMIDKDNISIPIKVNSDDGSKMIVVGILTFYRNIKTHNVFSSNDKILMRILGFCISYIIYTCKERQKIQAINRTYRNFSAKIPDIVNNSEISQVLVKQRLNLVNVFTCEDCAVILYDTNEQVFLALNPGSDLDDLRKGGKADLIRFYTPMGICGKVYEDGQAMILQKPRNHHSFQGEIDNLTPVKFLENAIYLRLETSNKIVLGVIQIINKRKDISDAKFAEIIDPISQIISNVIYAAMTSYRNQFIIENLQEEIQNTGQIYDDVKDKLFKQII